MAYPYEPGGGTTVIEVQHLIKRYGPVTAVDDISFTVERGEILGFLGANGAGKTTTMRVLTGYMPPSEGKAVVAGYDVFEQPIEAKRRTGYLPETPPLYPEMTVREYLSFVAKIKRVPRGERKARVEEMMRKTHVDDVANRHCGKLSKGYRQRVGLAQALMHTPDNLTSRLRGSETMYLQVDAGGADAAAVLERVSGVTRVVATDTKLQVVGYEVDSEAGRDVRRELAAAVVSRGWGLLEMRPMRMSLEEIFLHVTTEETAAPAAPVDTDTERTGELVS